MSFKVRKFIITGNITERLADQKSKFEALNSLPEDENIQVVMRIPHLSNY